MLFGLSSLCTRSRSVIHPTLGTSPNPPPPPCSACPSCLCYCSPQRGRLPSPSSLSPNPVPSTYLALGRSGGSKEELLPWEADSSLLPYSVPI
ncbi:hypothetical protein CSHISOI_03131 [Colletotrichum shisoi]|uniref:Uncharacterized protein n=1 Tax=Colletotrichum shisoi TaxID=2078593 RepID=A0A5Q4BZ54_9PEZI|nr:hypothetical protein CSHISOI_03131 [Colletotrichum shisoi]